MKSSTVAIIIIVLVAIGIIVWAVTSSQEGTPVEEETPLEGEIQFEEETPV